MTRLAWKNPGGVAKLKVNWSMASACAVEGMDKAEAIRTNVKRVLRMGWFPSEFQV
jgi:hypothetical protein